jgi:hypothetical protein
MRYAIIPLLFVCLFACSSTCNLQMDPDTDLSALPQDAQCWLSDVEDVCISLAANKSFSDTERLEKDIKTVAVLLTEMDSGDTGWYSSLDETQSDRLHSLLVAIAIHYGVKHFVDV